eukprot:scaffold4877_cov171-Ochromonas_danica.AAC.17
MLLPILILHPCAIENKRDSECELIQGKKYTNSIECAPPRHHVGTSSFSHREGDDHGDRKKTISLDI